MKFFLLISLLLVPCFVFTQDIAEEDILWNFVNEKPGIKVYTRDSKGSSIKELRILAELSGSIDTLMSIVNDANNFGSWVYKCSDSEPVIAPDGYNTAYAATTDFPFPLSDRELVAKSKHWVDEDGRRHTHSICAADELPSKSGIVRIKSYESRWLIEKITNDSISIEYISSVDPGGNIPSWVVNMAITAGPIKTFEKLIELVEKRSPLGQVDTIR